ERMIHDINVILRAKLRIQFRVFCSHKEPPFSAALHALRCAGTCEEAYSASSTLFQVNIVKYKCGGVKAKRHFHPLDLVYESRSFPSPELCHFSA
ncbi:MAG: hypothetical protein IKI54_01075, partial [Lachnospiraceae bacterium]|nr:hypothetical protein [Lachnospiraceae bacterium]